MKVPFIDLSLQHDPIRKELDSALRRVADSNQFYGKEVTAFEEAWAKYCGAKYCVACSSGTSALELALRSCGVGMSVFADEVVVPVNTFIATAEAVTAVGAVVRFADVSQLTNNLSPDTLRPALSIRTAAIIPVYLYGQPAPLGPIAHVVGSPGTVPIIVDAAQAHGAWGEGGTVRVGGEEHADLTCFSFYPTKNLGAFGDAGAVTTNDYNKVDFMRLYLDHGRSTHHGHILKGYNHRMAAIQAAVLRTKLPHLNEWNAKRRELARRYHRKLEDLSDIIRPQYSGEYVFHLYVVKATHRKALQNHLTGWEIGTGLHYPVPLHKTPAYQTDEFFLNAECIAKELLSLPLYPGMTFDQVDFVCGKIKEFYRKLP